MRDSSAGIGKDNNGVCAEEGNESMGWQELEIIWRTILLYGVILVIFRLMGKREIGELSVLDLVIFIMLGEIAVIAIEDGGKPLVEQIIPMVTLMLIQITLSLVSIKSQKLRKFLDGEPVILIRDGKIDERKMRKNRYNFDDLLIQLREKGIGDLRNVEYAILEPSGRLSVFQKQPNPKSQEQNSFFTLPLILDGLVQYDNLHKMKKTEVWLRQKLGELGYTDIAEISYCSFQDNQLFVDIIDK